jgi:hypothetical protein
VVSPSFSGRDHHGLDDRNRSSAYRLDALDETQWRSLQGLRPSGRTDAKGEGSKGVWNVDPMKMQTRQIRQSGNDEHFQTGLSGCQMQRCILGVRVTWITRWKTSNPDRC